VVGVMGGGRGGVGFFFWCGVVDFYKPVAERSVCCWVGG